MWSGKGHRADLMFQDLFAMDLASRQWWQVYDHTDGPQDASSPVSRCMSGFCCTLAAGSHVASRCCATRQS